MDIGELTGTTPPNGWGINIPYFMVVAGSGMGAPDSELFTQNATLPNNYILSLVDSGQIRLHETR